LSIKLGAVAFQRADIHVHSLLCRVIMSTDDNSGSNPVKKVDRNSQLEVEQEDDFESCRSRELQTVWQKLWNAICWVFSEFDPWLKWVVYDSILSLVVKYVSTRWKIARGVFEALGWL